MGPKRRCEVRSLYMWGPLIGLLCFGNCVFFFFFGGVSQLHESVWLGIRVRQYICYIVVTNTHRSVRRLSWQILHHFFLCVCTTRTSQLAPKKGQKKKKKVPPLGHPPSFASFLCMPHDLIGKLHMMLLTSSSWASTVFGSP